MLVVSFISCFISFLFIIVLFICNNYVSIVVIAIFVVIVVTTTTWGSDGYSLQGGAVGGGCSGWG